MISYRWYPKKELKERTGFQRLILDSSVSQMGKGAFLEASRVPEERDIKLAAFLGVSLWSFLINQPHIKWNAFERSRLDGWGYCPEEISGLLCTCSWASAYGNWLIDKAPCRTMWRCYLSSGSSLCSSTSNDYVPVTTSHSVPEQTWSGAAPSSLHECTMCYVKFKAACDPEILQWNKLMYCV